MNCVTYRALNDAKSIVSHEKLKKRQRMTKAAIYIPIAARRYACQPGCTTPYQNPSSSLLLLRRVIAALYRSEPRTVFGALNRRCPKPILEDGCDINRQGRQDETRDGRYLVGGRIKPIGTKPVGNMMIHHEVVVLEPK